MNPRVSTAHVARRSRIAANPQRAAAQFRKVLEKVPTHYGATHQLAAALDAAHRPTEARPLWEKVVRMAEGYKDQQTLDAARARLAQQP